MAELGCDKVLHEAGSDSVHICGALVQTHDARPPQKHARQAQQLLLPCAPAQPRTLNLTHPSTQLFKTQGTPPKLEVVPLQPDPSVHTFFFFWICSIISVEPVFQGPCFLLLKFVL